MFFFFVIRFLILNANFFYVSESKKNVKKLTLKIKLTKKKKKLLK